MSAPLFARWSFWGAVLLGAGARIAGLDQQILVGDEVHAFRGALALPLPEVLTTYRMQAHCPPFNAWLRAGIELGWRPSELALRVPVLLAGLAALLWVPRWLERRVGAGAATATAWLLALSPLLVYYSRFMRPYLPAALASAVAAAAFFDWWREGRTASGVAYASAASFAVYLHLLAAPFVLAPWLFLAGEAAATRGRSLPAPRRLVAVAGLSIALLALWMVPAAASLSRLAPSKSQDLALDLRTWREGGMLLAGVGWPWLAALFALAMARGLVVLSRRDASLARYAVALPLAQLVGVLALSPAYLQSPPIFARYLLVGLVPLLALAGLGLAEPLARVPCRVQVAAVGLYLAAAAASGPLVHSELYTSPFGLRPEILGFVSREPRPARSAPPPYARLAALSPGAVIEYPARPLSRFVNPLAVAQRAHGRRVYLSPGDRKLLDPRLDLQSFVGPEPHTLLASKAALLVVHRDWARELGPDLGAGPLPADLRSRAEEELARMAVQARRLVRRLVGAWGRPDLSQNGLAVWDLERVRRRAASP
ncbi:MAG: hypothetical protein ACRD0X_06495 [Thermoanaerobaculia bacterium]